MRDRRRLAWIVLLGALLGTTPAGAQTPCDGALVATTSIGGESGVGGTGHSDESGIGGTGHSGESGIGGTGLSGESGIGGTGLHVFGTLNAFGSLCVNGLRVVHDADLVVERAGETLGVADLAVGQVLWIDAQARDDTPRASQVEIVPTLTGVIEAVDRDARTLRIDGRAIDVTETATYGDGLVLRAGESVRVFGLWQDDTQLVATRIEAAPGAAPRIGPRLADLLRTVQPGARLSLEGYVAQRVGSARLHVEGLALDVERPVLERPLRIGDRIRALGSLSADRVLRIAPARPPTRPPPIERPPSTEPQREERPPVVERPPVLERPPVIEKPPVIDRIEAPPRIESVR